MAAITSASLLSVQARPTRLFSLENKSRNARPRSSVVMAAGKACRKEQAQIMAQRAMALLAATQLLAAPIAGPALAIDAPDAKGALEGVKDAVKPDKGGKAIGSITSGQGEDKKGPTGASSQVAESIKATQGANTTESDALADKFSKDTPASGAPAAPAKALGTTDGGL